MPTFTTIFRATVMVGVAILAVEAWQRYGPPAAHVKSIAARALEIAHDTLNQQEPTLALTAAPPVSLPTVGPELSVAASPGTVTAPPVMSAEQPPAAPPMFPLASAAVATPPTSTDLGTEQSADDRLKSLMHRLEKIGGTEPRLAAWGSSGQLYRFCCRATLNNASPITRHFEAVAAEPLVAVEDVVAKVEAWRAAEQDRGRLR
jgi:hypothetical protein